MAIDLTQAVQITSVVAAAGIGLAFSIQRMLKNWKETSTETTVLTMMHNELERMSKHNTVLSVELSKLQTEIIRLNRELAKLIAENQRLVLEVSMLNQEIGRLKGAITREINPS